MPTSIKAWGQSNLPKLPVPPLDQTLQKFLRSVKPLNSPEDYQNAEKVSGGHPL